MALSCSKELSSLLRGITSKHQKICENKDFCNVIMPSEDTKIIEFNQYQKCNKAPLVIYADLECITGKIHGYKNNPENSYTTKVSEYI